jgi:hypothetical protein
MDLLNKLQIEMAIKETMSMMDEFRQLCEMVSIQQKIYYDALLEQGFSEKQALEIVKTHGVDAGRISKFNQNDRLE